MIAFVLVARGALLGRALDGLEQQADDELAQLKAPRTPKRRRVALLQLEMILSYSVVSIS